MPARHKSLDITRSGGGAHGAFAPGRALEPGRGVSGLLPVWIQVTPDPVIGTRAGTLLGAALERRPAAPKTLQSCRTDAKSRLGTTAGDPALSC
jgi:hypothetical protein